MAKLLGAESVTTPTNRSVSQRILACQFTAASTNTLEELVFKTNSTQTSIEASIGIYEDNAGTPGVLLAQKQVSVAAGEHLVKVTGFTVNLTEGTVYWIAAVSASIGLLLAVIGEAEAGASETVRRSTEVNLTSLQEGIAWNAPQKQGPLIFYGFGGAGLITKLWAGPFQGLYRGRYIGQGSQVEIPPAEAVSGWFR